MPLKHETVRISFKLPEPAAAAFSRMTPSQRVRLMAKVRTWTMFQMAALTLESQEKGNLQKP